MSETKKPLYEMPHVKVGEIVYWYPGGEKSSDPLPAIVTAIASETICCSLFATNLKSLMIQDGVRHMSDPRKRQAELLENGAWEHTPMTLQLAVMVHQLNQLMLKAAQAK